MQVRQLMNAQVQSCRPDTGIADVAALMSCQGCGLIPVNQGDKPIGVITDRDIALRVVEQARKDMQFVLVETLHEALAAALPDTVSQPIVETAGMA